MENIFVEFLPPWIETGLQPAFYDKESGTVLQQTARMYARVNMLIRMFNKLSKNTKEEVERFETSINETVENYIEQFNQLHDYVHDYFDNLDVQEEINNKLDQMVEDGILQEIITTYIQSNVAWTFDTVSDMKQATNLVNGSYAQTLGFHSINDGGGALYKISDTGTANEMDIIAIGSTLYANLVYGDKIDVKQVGAYGDDTTDDYNYFARARDIARANSIIFYVPKATYKISSQLELKALTIRCEGHLDNDQTLIIGANSSGINSTNAYIYRCRNVQIEGSKRGYFNLVRTNDIIMYSDGNSDDNKSQAYNHIEGIECSSFTINGVNGGWINENVINIKRCLNSITITGDGTYKHNNNRFTNISLEGSAQKIKIDYGFYNFISYRGESDPIVEINSPTSFGNTIAKQYENLYYRMYGSIDNNTSMNFIGAENLPTAKVQKIMDVNLSNVKNLNTGLNINGDGLITGNYQNEYVNSDIDPTKPFTLIVKSNTNSQRVYIECFDENDDKMQAYVGSAIIEWNETNEWYQLNSDAKATGITYAPTPGVKRIKIRITSGTHTFKWATAYLATPFMNFDEYRNEINTEKKYGSNAPSSSNFYWEVGDVIYKSAPTAGGTIGWVCVTAGNPGTWKAFGTIAS